MSGDVNVYKASISDLGAIQQQLPELRQRSEMNEPRVCHSRVLQPKVLKVGQVL
jgi:hypothetical protein